MTQVSAAGFEPVNPSGYESGALPQRHHAAAKLDESAKAKQRAYNEFTNAAAKARDWIRRRFVLDETLLRRFTKKVECALLKISSSVLAPLKGNCHNILTSLLYIP